mgnify:FL=1
MTNIFARGSVDLSLVALAGVFGLLAVAVPTVAIAQEQSRDETEALPIRPGTLAVIPFVNISAEPLDDWIGVGIAETVSVDLKRFEAVSVIGRTAFTEEARALTDDMPSSGADIDDAEQVARGVGRRLGVAWLITGGYQRLGDQVRITARVVDIKRALERLHILSDAGLD